MKNGLLSVCTIAVLSLAFPLSARQQIPPHSAFLANLAGKNSFRTETAEAIESGRLIAQNSSSKPAATAKSPGSTTTTTKSTTTNSSKSKSKSKSKKPKYVSLFPGQYPEATERLLIEKDIEHLTPWGMKVMLNEIYARQGYIFKDAELKKHFAAEKWYKGKQSNMNKIKLSNTEKQNIAFIKSHQNKAKI